jgi:DNA-binding GntR family transcriptional regulator
MKNDTVYKRKFNEVLQYIVDHPAAPLLQSENRMADQFAVSRTTVRKILQTLAGHGIIGKNGSGRAIVRLPEAADYFPRAETVPTSDRVEKKFMEWLLRDDRRPGDFINGLELARQFGVSTSGIREYLNRFSRFGLIEKRPNSRWLFRGFTERFALELFEIRELFELRSAEAFARQPPEAAAWQQLAALEREHRLLLKQIETRYHDFSDLDERFHRLINDASQNRFIVDFYDVISMIFHYHYQWNKLDEKQRNAVAILEHLEYITALASRDMERVAAACRLHLGSARRTLLAAIA